MNRILIVIVALAGAYFALEHSSSTPPRPPVYEQPNEALEAAIRSRRTGYQVHGSGRILRLLSDDREGSRHQRFIVRLGSGQTVLIAHNIDLAPRVADIRVGQPVSFFGEYEWNERGGVIHWTHHDPAEVHVAGWVEHNGTRYQ